MKLNILIIVGILILTVAYLGFVNVSTMPQVSTEQHDPEVNLGRRIRDLENTASGLAKLPREFIDDIPAAQTSKSSVDAGNRAGRLAQTPDRYPSNVGQLSTEPALDRGVSQLTALGDTELVHRTSEGNFDARGSGQGDSYSSHFDDGKDPGSLSNNSGAKSTSGAPVATGLVGPGPGEGDIDVPGLGPGEGDIGILGPATSN